MKRTQIRPRSKKRAALMRAQRVPLVKAMLEEDGPHRCEFPLGCQRIADTVHEFYSRGQGGPIVGPDNIFFRSCVVHNEWAESHPVEAHELGWRFLRKAA